MAFQVGTLYALLEADDRQFRAALDRAHSRMKKAEGASKALLGALVGMGAGLTATALKGIQLAGQMEQTKIAFTTLLGDARKADAFLKQLWDFARTTPFEFEGLTQSARQLLAFGFTAQEIIPMVRAVGDAISALGGGEAEIQRVIYALGQMRAKGKVSAEEMMQLAELGIPAWEMLAKAIGKSIPEAMELASKGAIPAAKGIEAIVNGMNARFAGAMEKQSKTILGRWSTIKDNLTGILRLLGQEIIDTFNLGEVMDRVGSALERLTGLLQEKGLRGALEGLAPPWLTPALFGIAGAITGALVPAFGALAVAIWGAVAPLAPFIAAGAALGAVAFLVYKNWDRVKQAFATLYPVVAPAIEGVKQSVGSLVSYVVTYWPQIRQTLQTFLQWVGPIFKAVWSGVVDTVRFYLRAIADIVRGVVGVITGIIKLFAAILAGDWKAAWNAVKQIFSSALTALWGLFRLWIVGRLMAAFGSVIRSILGAVGRFVGGLLGRVTGGMSRFAGVIRGGLTQVKNLFLRMVTDVITMFGRLGARMVNIGRRIVEGLWNGIKKMAGWLADRVTGFVKNAIPGPIAKLLGIQSPSRLMMEYGQNVAAGLVIGIEKKLRAVAAAAARMAEAATATVPAVTAPVVPKLALAGAGAAPVNTQPIYLDVTLEINDEVLARRLIGPLDQIMAFRQGQAMRAKGLIR